MAAETTPAIGLLDMMQTAAEDVGAVVRFYSEVLGATVEVEGEQWSQLRIGGVSLGICTGGSGARISRSTVSTWPSIIALN